MKKYILAVAVAMASLFASCSSDSVINAPITNEKTLHEAVFTINNVAPQMGTVETRSTSLTDAGIKYLEYWVFNTEDVTTSVMSKDALLRDTLTNYNEAITLKLPVGDYTIVFFATDSDEKIVSTAKSNIDVVDGKYQMYSAKKQFVISEENTVIKEYISLDRIIGKLEFVIEDLNSLPADVQSITFVGIGAHPLGSAVVGAKLSTICLANGRTDGRSQNSLLPTIARNDFAKYNKDNPIFVYVLPQLYSDYSTDIRLNTIYVQGTKDSKFYTDATPSTAFPRNSNIVFNRMVGNYRLIKPNTITRFTGKIGSLDSLDHEVSFEDEWTTSEIDAD